MKKREVIEARWRKVQIVSCAPSELLGYTLWMRWDTPPSEMPEMRHWKTKRRVDIGRDLCRTVNLVGFLQNRPTFAAMPLHCVRVLDEWTDTPPLWDNAGWAQWSTRLPLPREQHRKKSRR